MKNKYFKKLSKSFGYSANQEKPEQNIRPFHILAEKYDKSDMKVEIIEYEIKD